MYPAYVKSSSRVHGGACNAKADCELRFSSRSGDADVISGASYFRDARDRR